jgi:hypothetical protein
MDRGGSSCLVFRRVARKCETASGSAWDRKACSIHPGIAGKCWPDKGNHVMEKESRKIKKLQHVPQEFAPAAAVFAFFCHIPLQYYRVATR